MPGNAEADPVRIDLRLAVGVLDWVAESLRVGQHFTSESQAVESALARLEGEQSFIRARCRLEGTKFRAAAFWQLYDDQIQASGPNKRGPRSKQAPQAVKRKVVAGIRPSLLHWTDSICHPKGPFATVSHAVEAGLMHLRSIEAPSEIRVAGTSFMFPHEALWQRYCQALTVTA